MLIQSYDYDTQRLITTYLGNLYPLSVITMACAQILNCIVWDEPMRPRQQAVQCAGCFRWNHQICNTGKLYLTVL